MSRSRRTTEKLNIQIFGKIFKELMIESGKVWRGIRILGFI